MNIDMIFHGTQPGGQEGRSAEKRGSAPLTFTLGKLKLKVSDEIIIYFIYRDSFNRMRNTIR